MIFSDADLLNLYSRVMMDQHLSGSFTTFFVINLNLFYLDICSCEMDIKISSFNHAADINSSPVTPSGSYLRKAFSDTIRMNATSNLEMNQCLCI